MTSPKIGWLFFASLLLCELCTKTNTLWLRVFVTTCQKKSFVFGRNNMFKRFNTFKKFKRLGFSNSRSFISLFLIFSFLFFIHLALLAPLRALRETKQQTLFQFSAFNIRIHPTTNAKHFSTLKPLNLLHTHSAYFQFAI